MLTNELQRNIKFVRGVGEKRAELFTRLGVTDVASLISLYPRTYEDWSAPVSVGSARAGETCCVRAFVVSPVTDTRISGGRRLSKLRISDGLFDMTVTYFNNPYISKKLKEGNEYLFYGKVTLGRMGREMISPTVSPVGETPAMKAVYPQTAGLNSGTISKVVANALELLKDKEIDPLPPSVREEYSLPEKHEALRMVHFPSNAAEAQEGSRRLAFEELLIFQLGLAKLRSGSLGKTGPDVNCEEKERFISSLDFPLTGAQRRAVDDICRDMSSGRVMNRLVQGDVGSGKTVVAAAAVYCAARSGFQTAFMAPTEILATQHSATFSRLFAPFGIRTALLIGSMTAAEKRKIKEGIILGIYDLVIGTHALITGDVEFRKLGLVVTDEQHRFGVSQRAALSAKGADPHLLVMSATPIPRTLSLILYGDLDISVIDELPPGRRPVRTYAVDTSYRERAYAYVRKHLDAGFKGYVICPLVEENENLDLVPAKEYCESLKNGPFKGYSVGLLHGKMKPKEKDSVMKEFAEGELQLLVATTVVEVGVDVPSAVIMLIENAERFGLSALHQLRGRVGRGGDQASCILISDASGDTAKQRIAIMTSTTDGFKIADEDLKMRGPGDFLGSRQHGIPMMQMTGRLSDGAAVRESSMLSKRMLGADPDLSSQANEGLRHEVERAFADARLTLN